MIEEVKKSSIAAVWFMFLTFPLVVIRVDVYEELLQWRWGNMAAIGVGTFFLSWVWRYLLQRRALKQKKPAGAALEESPKKSFSLLALADENPKMLYLLLGGILVAASIFPFTLSAYQTAIMTTALMYIVLGLGLNIVVGLAGLLDLGYVAFYAIGAYSYALLNMYFGMSFWMVLPIGAALAAMWGFTLGFPTLRLRGDYLAIVTLGFGEIVRLVLENWSDLTQGPRGVPNIPKPTLFGIDMGLEGSMVFMYFLILMMVCFTIFVIFRLNNSRIGRAWVALREDEIACQAMGINTTKIKLLAFAFGASWAGATGVFFAAKNSFVSPISFTFLQSAMILCIVVLGGMGSILGIILAALFLILLPEYMRAFSEYRMLLFGVVMIVMMIFRPEGLISNVRRKYKINK